MSPNSDSGPTELLRAWSQGDGSALDRLMPLVYNELHSLARRYMRQERPDHTLQPTSLVNEAYLRLIDVNRVEWRNRTHFLALAAQMMRRILVDYARAHHAARRPGAGLRVSLTEGMSAVPPVDCELLLLDQALNELAALDPRQAQIVEFRYFSGFSEQEVAEVLSISRSTVTREWQTARAWLYRRLTTGPDRGAP
jgi:RNA polymerase sigma factor (TIGR02999 family)